MQSDRNNSFGDVVFGSNIMAFKDGDKIFTKNQKANDSDFYHKDLLLEKDMYWTVLYNWKLFRIDCITL